jgi:hypothetical protein
MKLMAKLWLMTFFLVSCGQENVEYLYSKYDSEYNDVLLLAQAECIENNKIFEILDRTNSFDTYGYKVGNLYKMVEEFKEDKNIRYAKILSIQGNTMRIGIRSSNATEDKVIVYTQEDNKKLLATVSTGVCSPQKYYSNAGLNRTDLLSFGHTRTNVIKGTEQKPERYIKITENYKLHKDFPLILHMYSGTKTEEKKLDDANATTKTATLSIKTIDDNECAQDTLCEFQGIDATKLCYPKVDDKHYTRKKVEEVLVNLEFNCPSTEL